MHSDFDIGLVGIYTMNNFGGALTNYALYKVLVGMGYKVMLIERPLNSRREPLSMKIYDRDPFPDHDKSDLYQNKESMRVLNGCCDAFIVGSDQLFHINQYADFSEWMTLDWVKDSKKKISYAASFGHDVFTGSEDVRSEMSYFMKKFDKFSVREKSGILLAKDLFGVDAEWVLDPIFLCDPCHYHEISAPHEPRDEYISAYILDMTYGKKTVLDHVRSELNIPYELYSEFEFETDEFHEFGCDITCASIDKRLESMINSKLIITDSFHGLCFAIIFKKPFVVFRNRLRGATRFESLMSLLGIEDRLVDTLSDLTSRPELMNAPDYEHIYKILEIEKIRSKKWLTESLNDPKLKSLSAYDIVIEKIEQQNKKINKMIEEGEKTKSLLIPFSMITHPEIIRHAEDIYTYLSSLKHFKEGFFVICVKDTSGYLIGDEIVSLMKDLGLSVNLKDRVWQGYIAVIENGSVIFEELSEQNLPSEFIGKSASGVDIIVRSKPLKAGDLSEIIVDGVDNSSNGRGLNIVVYSSKYNQVIDSISFDTHNRGGKILAFRKGHQA